ncbi:MAG: hypothetical protein HRU15_13345 [Planctomycetes bacterium]|nr:hypothetical protein [Planctomycetota bacterium]
MLKHINILLIIIISQTYLYTAVSIDLQPLASDVFIPENMPKTGYFTGSYDDPETNTQIIKYCIKTPDRLPDRRTLVLIADFHGCGGNEESFKWTKQNYPEIDEKNLMWVGMKAQDRCWSGGDHDRITQCLDWVIKSYPIDERRIIFRGYSSGAFLQKSYGAKRQDLVCGIIQYAGGGGIPSYSKDPENMATEFYLACGEKDKFFDSAFKSEIKSLQSSKYRFIARSWDQHDHTSHFDKNDPQVAAVSQEVFHWLWSLRHKTRGLYKENIDFLKGLKKKEHSEIWNKQATVDEIVRIGGIEAGGFVIDAMKSKDDTIVLKAIASCMRVNYSNAVTTTLGKLYFKSKSETVRQAAATALCRLAQWRHKPAQLALNAKIMDKKATESDKLLAIKGIAACIDFQLFGTYATDFDLYKSLIFALNDASESVRNAAFSTIKKCNKDDFAYTAQQDKKTRKKSLRAWQNWFAGFIDKRS